jgi:hypothetical protein
MNIQVQPRFEAAERRLPFECIALVLQGGGALGAYQAGVYESCSWRSAAPDDRPARSGKQRNRALGGLLLFLL